MQAVLFYVFSQFDISLDFGDFIDLEKYLCVMHDTVQTGSMKVKLFFIHQHTEKPERAQLRLFIRFRTMETITNAAFHKGF